MDFINNYGSSDEEDNSTVDNTNSSSALMTVNSAPDTGFDVRLNLYIHTLISNTKALIPFYRLVHLATYIQLLQQLS